MGNWGRVFFVIYWSWVGSVFAICPAMSPTQRYIQTKLLTEFTVSAGVISVYYTLLAPFDKTKPTLVVLNGGPGGDHTLFHSFGRLKEQFNVVGFDHRGVGCTKIITRPPMGYHKGLYSMSRASDDLEAIRKDLLGETGKWFVYGVSYGTMLGQQYVLRYPEASLGLILDSAAHDTKAIGLARNQYVSLFIDEIPEVKALFEKITVKYPDARNLLLRKILGFTYSYQGRTVMIKELFSKVLAAPTPEKAKELYTPMPDEPFVGMTMKIVCEEIYDYPKDTSAYFWPALDIQCPVFRPFRKPMSFGSWLTKLSLRTLILGGKFDPVTPIQAMREMRDRIPGSVLYENPYAGHGLLWEKSECSFRLIRMLLQGAPMGDIKVAASSADCLSAPPSGQEDLVTWQSLNPGLPF